MTTWAEQSRRADVVVLTALRLEYDAVLQVDDGAMPGSSWERTSGPSGLPLAFRAFATAAGRPLRVAVAVAPDMGAVAATNTLLPLVEALGPRCIAMCGVCAGRPGKTEFGDVVAASRLFYHDSGKRLPDRTLADLVTYQLGDGWKSALAGMDFVTRFRDAAWFKTRPLTSAWRELRALVALRDGAAAPWHDLDQKTWAATVAALQEQRLIAGRELTDDGRRVVDDLLFRYQGRLPDLSPSGEFQPFRVHVAPMASGNQVIEDVAIWDTISQSVRTVLALEMEGASLGQLAHCQRQLGLDAVVMKGVMDFANHGRDDHFKPFAARASAECLLAFLRDHAPTEAIASVDDLLSPGTTALEDAPSPSSLLVARHTVVPWYERGRAEILSELDAWADDPARDVAVRLVHAAGGVGKTRLAIEWTRRRRERGDVAGFLDTRPGDRWLDRLCGYGAPVMIAVDYAEGRIDLVELLMRLARYAAAPGARRRVRMLLLARGDGDWWMELQRRRDAIGALLRATAPTALLPLARAAPDREAVFADAAAGFATALGNPVAPRRPIALSDPQFDRALYLHMAALAAVMGVAFDAGTLMDAILDHEERFWQHAAATRQQATVDVELARQLVAAATLRGGIQSQDEAHELCERLLRRPRSRGDDALIAVLHDVYQRAGDRCYLPGLEPDLLGEAMVVRVAASRQRGGAAAREAWIERVFVADDDEQALTRAFTVLGRASVAVGSPLRAWIASLLETELSARAIVTLRAAKLVARHTAHSPLGDVLAEVLERRGSLTIARALHEEGIPYPTVSLQRVAIWRSRMALDSVGIAADDRAMVERARWCLQRELDLGAAGQRAAALEAIREAVALYRQLVARDRDAFQPELAMSLNNLGLRSSDLGLREAAHDATREAVALARELAARHPDAFRPGLARMLHCLGLRSSELGQREAALEATREAVALFRELAARDSEEFHPHLAGTLSDLVVRLTALGQRDAALDASREAVAICRRLAARGPDALQPRLAGTLTNLGISLGILEQHEAAVDVTRDVVALYRRLAARNPDAFQPDLARSLNNLGNHLGNLGQREAALEAIREAVALRRQLAARNPDAFRPGLAGTLNNLGNRLSELGQRDAALEAAREAVALYRQLAAGNPDTFQPDVAISVDNLSIRLGELGQGKAALEAAREAIGLRRELATRNPDALHPGLVAHLNRLGIGLKDLGQHDAALEVIREVVALYRRLVVRNADAFQRDLASSLNDLGTLLSDLGQRDAGLEAIREARQLMSRAGSADRR